MVTSAQLRAARALLNWTVRDLAEKAGVHRNTVTRAETDETEPGYAVAQIIRTFEAAGVEFTNGGQPGVRVRKVFQTGDFVRAAEIDPIPKVSVGKDHAGNGVTDIEVNPRVKPRKGKRPP